MMSSTAPVHRTSRTCAPHLSHLCTAPHLSHLSHPSHLPHLILNDRGEIVNVPPECDYASACLMLRTPVTFRGRSFTYQQACHLRIAQKHEQILAIHATSPLARPARGTETAAEKGHAVITDH
jgi:hypothetical protein